MTEENVMKKRKTMKYPQYEMINEHDLHYKVVDFIRKYYPEAIVIPGLGELQHTSAMRCDAWQKGYKGGQPDILIANKNNDFIGLAIELKTPAGTGKVSDNQTMFLNRLEEAGYHVIISNDYDEILMTIVGYFKNAERGWLNKDLHYYNAFQGSITGSSPGREIPSTTT